MFGRIWARSTRLDAPKRIAALAVALLVGAAAPAEAQETEAAAPCDRFAAGTVAGAVADPSLVEISGVVASRAHPGVLWVHNDSGGQPAVTALSDTGADLGTYEVPGATATDWEDIAAGPGPEDGRSYLYVADIGDNGAARESVQVHRVPEPDDAPDGADGRFADDEVLTLRYPDGPVDAEALLVDPRSGDLFVVGKRAAAAPVYAASADALVAGEVPLRQVATLDAAPVGGPPGPLGLVTGGDVSPDGSVVLLRTYVSVAAYARADDEPLEAAFTATPCAAPQVSEPQGEALGFLADGSAYVTISEGAAAPVNRFAVGPALAPTTTTTTTAPGAGEATADEEEDDGGGVGVVAVVGGVVLLAAVGGAVVWALRRRRH
jgi:hypothetical protein